jgi:cellobiose phosphorylase
VWTTPLEADLALRRINNDAGLSASILPNGSLFGIEHDFQGGAIQINQVLGSPLEGGIGRILLRAAGARPFVAEAVGRRASASLELGAGWAAWEGANGNLWTRASLRFLPGCTAWLWQVDVFNGGAETLSLDAVLIQDIGLASREFLANNEAYASQYIDHHIALHGRFGPVVMSRQNLAQGQKHPWLVQGCLDGVAGFATDGMQVFGPLHRDGGGFVAAPFGSALPSARLQHELACGAVQSKPASVPPQASARWRFFALYVPDHPAASSNADLARIDAIPWPEPVGQLRSVGRSPSVPARSVLQDAPCAVAAAWDEAALARRYPRRSGEERKDGRLLSFFVADDAAASKDGTRCHRHVVLRAKELLVARRHGTLLRSGQALLPDEATLCATAWMHGVFGAQLTLGNTSFHKVFSVSRDPYNITRASGLRMLVDSGGGWRLLAVPSAFEMGLSDCRWIYDLDGSVVTVHAVAAGVDPAMHWHIGVEGSPCRLLVIGHLVLGEREFEQAGSIDIDGGLKRFTLRPGPQGLWGKHYPGTVFHLVTSMPDVVEAIGGSELLYGGSGPPGGPCVAMRTVPMRLWRFSLVGTLTDAGEAARLAARYESGIDEADLLAAADCYWRRVTRGVHIVDQSPEHAPSGHSTSSAAAADVVTDTAALNTVFPWLAHNAIIHLTVPHGLEQYTGAAWGTRDVCQGPVEFLLALEHDEAVKSILRIVFAQQYAARGDWPQWFMLEPYSSIQDGDSHGDVIVWPLKALNDYLESTGDLGFLDEEVAWRDDASLVRTARRDSIAAHIERLLERVVERFIPGTHLIRYGEGDWNDSLQPADPRMRDWMVSGWTVALLYQQLGRYAEVLRRSGREARAQELRALAGCVREDFNRYLLRDGTVAGYGLFAPPEDPATGTPAAPGVPLPELLIHPLDTRTGLRYSLLPMTRSIIAGLFTPEQARHHLRIIRQHLLFPDGARLLDRPVAYQGGPQSVFRRAESAAFFGREIGLMYVHAHLRCGEAMAALGEADALWETLALVNPVAISERLGHASPRQRNAFFSSSDAAFRDRYEADAGWARVRAGTVAVEGGWRIYSSGPGLYVRLLVEQVFGVRRCWGLRTRRPLLPADRAGLRLRWDLGPPEADST